MSSSTLSHPLVIDGWFHERNSQWPGQAFTLQVEKILHTEQSKFQDVLVFKSANHGNVLVLGGCRCAALELVLAVLTVLCGVQTAQFRLVYLLCRSLWLGVSTDFHGRQ